MGHNVPDVIQEGARTESEFMQLQMELMQEQRHRQELLRPVLMAELGIEPVFEDTTRANPEHEQLQQRLESLRGELSDLDAVPDDGGDDQFRGPNAPPGAGGGDQRAQVRESMERRRQRNQLEQEISDIEEQLAGTAETIGSEEEIVAFEREEDPLEEQRRRIEQLELDRAEAALEGELPVSPALEQNLESQEQELRATLRDRLGPGFETSTPGIEALGEFNQRAEALREEARRGQLTTAEGLALDREEASSRRLGEFISRTGAVAGMSPSGGGGMGGGFMSQMGNIQVQNRRNAAERRAENVGGGAALGAEIGGTFGPVGAVVGGVGGAVLGDIFS